MTAPAAAATVFGAAFSGANEVPAVTTTGGGYGTLTLSANNQVATVNIAFGRLSAPIAAAHLHCCAAPGTSGGVALNFVPPSIAAGSFTRMFDLTLASTYGTAFFNGSAGPGLATAATAQARLLAGLNAGQAYFNLHTSNFPGGEIRANLAAVPEPSSWAMLIAGFGFVGAAARRRRLAAA